jgi:RNA polymerase sigma-70 factor, ECF subfamily
LALLMPDLIDWRNRGHFLALAATIMRRYLIDHARSRPSIDFLPMAGLPEHILVEHSKLELAVAVDSLLNELEKRSHQQRAVVELKFFLGLTDKEAADALDLTLHTFQREWHRARTWLYDRLSAAKWKAVPNTTSA